MIIDGHVHLFNEGWIHEDMSVGTARVFAASIGKATGEYPDAVEMARNTGSLLWDATGEKLIGDMDAAGVDKSCFFAVDYGLATGEPEVSIEAQNRMVAEVAKRFPDRLIPFFSIDPRRPGAAELLSRALDEWGMKGLKLHPTSGYFPFDKVCYPLYDKCVEYGVPVLIHTGAIMAPLKSRYCLPIDVDEVAADFPELPIIMAHAAWSMWRDALQVAYFKPNIYFDFSCWQFIFNQFPEEFYSMLRRIIDVIGPWRIFFGSDGPLWNLSCPLNLWVQAIREPDLASCPDISFTGEEKEIILGKGLAQLLNIED
jgi:predicted TIM-barrel fold metal-dependent hydrolase